MKTCDCTPGVEAGATAAFSHSRVSLDRRPPASGCTTTRRRLELVRRTRRRSPLTSAESRPSTAWGPLEHVGVDHRGRHGLQLPEDRPRQRYRLCDCRHKLGRRFDRLSAEPDRDDEAGRDEQSADRRSPAGVHEGKQLRPIARVIGNDSRAYRSRLCAIKDCKALLFSPIRSPRAGGAFSLLPDAEIAGKNGNTFHDSRDRNENFWAFGQPVLAVADGEVTEVVDGVPDNTPDKLPVVTVQNITGNHVIIRIGTDTYVRLRNPLRHFRVISAGRRMSLDWNCLGT